jgi:hypothetical protein
MVFVAIGWLLPKFYDPFVPVEKRGEGHLEFAPNEAVAVVEAFRNRVGGGGGGVEYGGYSPDGVEYGGYSPDEPVGFGGKAMA